MSAQKVLDLRGKQLSSLPESVIELRVLEELDLDENQLESLPEAIGRLGNLRTLSLYSNRLVSLPEALWQLTNLEKLPINLIRLLEAFDAALARYAGRLLRNNAMGNANSFHHTRVRHRLQR